MQNHTGKSFLYLDESCHSIWTQQDEMFTQPIVCHFEIISLAIGLENFSIVGTRFGHLQMHEPTLVIHVVIC